jgi:uncharacterized protein (TIGR02594 family)
MDKALAERGKEVKELRDNKSFEQLWYLALAQAHDEWSTLTKREEQPKYSLLGKNDRKELDLMGVALREADAARGRALARENPEIATYFENVKTDPRFDNKGRSFDISCVNSSGHEGWKITAWCAAFVNWCLREAGVPHLGYSTAISWLEFGTPLPAPVYGCITIVPPSTDTGSSTGHVAFYEKTEGKSVILIGGNQSDQVKRSPFKKVLGYRWPTAFNYYLTPEKGDSRLA